MKILPLLPLLLALCGSAAAQDATPGDLEKRIEKQERALEQLKHDLAQLKKAHKKKPQRKEFRYHAPKEFRFNPTLLPPRQLGSGPSGVADRRSLTWASKTIKMGLFYIESRDKAYRLSLNMRLLPQFSFSPQRQPDTINSFADRQARFNFRGRLWNQVSFHVALEVGQGTTGVLKQGWLNLRILQGLQIKAGQEKIPLTITFDEPFMYMNQPEWPMLVGNDAQSFELGAWLHGALFGGLVDYMIGADNGNGGNQRLDNNDDSNLNVRIDLKPFKGLVLRAAFDYTPTNRQPTNVLRDARTLGGFYTKFVDYNDAIRRLSDRRRVEVGLRYRHGPFELMSEFLLDYHRRLLAPNMKEMNLTIWSWYVEGLWIITGETKGSTIEEVRSPFYTPKRGFGTGAWGVSLRFEDYDVENSAFTRGFATGTDKAYAVLGTLSWWPYLPLRCSVSYSWTGFSKLVADSTGRRHHDDNVVLVRMWLSF